MDFHFLIPAIPYFVAAVLILVPFLVHLYRKDQRDLRDFLDRFEKAFPGRCQICAYHQYGIREGHVKPGTLPKDHRCVEKWNRWKGHLHEKT